MTVEENLVVQATFLAGATSVASLPPPESPEIAFAGRSNVGKSSLLNALCQRNGLVRASKTPGRTRQINVFRADLHDGLVVNLADLPGYGYAKLSKTEKASWGAMLENYLRERTTLRALVLIVDVRRGFEPDDEQLLEFLRTDANANRERPVEAITVVTKLDKLALAARKPALMALAKASGRKSIGFSAVTADGRDDLWRRIRFVVADKAVTPEGDSAT